MCPLAEELGVLWNKTHDVRTGGRSTVSADDDSVPELDGHNRCLDNAPVPQSTSPSSLRYLGDVHRG